MSRCVHTHPQDKGKEWNVVMTICNGDIPCSRDNFSVGGVSHDFCVFAAPQPV